MISMKNKIGKHIFEHKEKVSMLKLMSIDLHCFLVQMRTLRPREGEWFVLGHTSVAETGMEHRPPKSVSTILCYGRHNPG